MLKFKQTPLAIIGMFVACSLADGEPTPGQLKIALIITVATCTYVILCVAANNRKETNK